MKRIFSVVILLFVIGMPIIFAWPGGNNTYACPGTSVTIKFWAQGVVDISVGGETWRNAGNYRVSGNRLTVTFKTTSEISFSTISGVTWAFNIIDDETLKLQDGSLYVRI